ncbi:virion structural protein [Pseudomonas phage PIP]|nr:virion structural protein [Pseudomonas phage PIP]
MHTVNQDPPIHMRPRRARDNKVFHFILGIGGFGLIISAVVQVGLSSGLWSGFCSIVGIVGAVGRPHTDHSRSLAPRTMSMQV